MTQVMPAGAPLLETFAGTDHKRIGLGVGAIAFGFFLAGGVLAMLMRTELAEPGLQVVSLSTYNALFTMHGSTMIYLFVTPVALALGLYLVPLQVGASGLAGSRFALAGMWLLVLGGITMWSGFLVRGGAAQATWSGFDPLSNAVNSPGKAMDSWIWGVVLATLGELLMAASLLATLLGRRIAGMTLLRMPIFCWAQLVTCLMTLFAFPVLIAALVALWIDRQWGGVFTGPGGPVTYQHLFWFYGHPVVYVMFFPFLGAVAEVIAVFSGRRLFGYRGMVLSLLVFASLSMSVWAHHSSIRAPTACRTKARRPPRLPRCPRSPLSGELPQARERAAQDAGDLHLRQPESRANLGLGEVVLESQAHGFALVRWQSVQQRIERGGVLGAREPGIVDERVMQVVVRVVSVRRGIEPVWVVGAGRRECLEDVLGAGAEHAGDLGGRRRSAERSAQSGGHGVDLDRALLQVAWHAHGPAMVAEVALELAENRGHGVRGERDPAGWVVTVDRLQEAE
jgi:hypothetical protein